MRHWEREEKEETLAMEEEEQKVQNELQPGPRSTSCGRSGQEPHPASPRRTPDAPGSSHLAAPGAGDWLVPGFSSSSSSLSREGFRGAKNREKLCQGALPLLRPLDISPDRPQVGGRLLGMDEAVPGALRLEPRSALWDPARARLTLL